VKLGQSRSESFMEQLAAPKLLTLNSEASSGFSVASSTNRGSEVVKK
jgi:hypothetical protein